MTLIYTEVVKKILRYVPLILLFSLLINKVHSQKLYKPGDTLNIFAQSGLNMRKSPGLASRKIGIIPYGEQVIVLTQLASWVSIFSLYQMLISRF